MAQDHQGEQSPSHQNGRLGDGNGFIADEYGASPDRIQSIIRKELDAAQVTGTRPQTGVCVENKPVGARVARLMGGAQDRVSIKSRDNDAEKAAGWIRGQGKGKSQLHGFQFRVRRHHYLWNTDIDPSLQVVAELNCIAKP